MRYTNTVNTQIMLANAREDQKANQNGYFELNRGEEVVSVMIDGEGFVSWLARGKPTSEEGVMEVLARWAVEGVL